MVDWGSTGHLEGVGCLADAAGQSNSTVLIGSCGWRLRQRTRHLLLQVGPRQEDINSRMNLPRDMLLFRSGSTGYPDNI